MATLANQWGPTELEYPNGMSAAGIAIVVRNAADNTLAILYDDKNKTSVIANPVSTDYLGNLKFWTEPGEYLLEYSTISLPIVVPWHPDELSADTPRVLKYAAGWPTRGTSPRPTLFVGGSAATDQPIDVDLTAGDLWFPATA